MRSKIVPLKLASALAGTLMLCGCPKPGPPSPPTVPPTVDLGPVWSEFDKFQAQLTERARTVIGDSDDYRIVATTLDYPIGTLLRLDRVVPMAECKVTEPRSALAPNMFPDYKLSKNLAVSLGVDAAVLSQVASMGGSIKDDNTFSIRISGTTVRSLNDRELKDLLQSKECTDAMNGQPARLIRGQVIGQRDFSTVVSTTGELNAQAKTIGSFKVAGGVGNSTISIQDAQPRAFLQVISLVTPPTSNESSASVAGAASAATIAASAVAVASLAKERVFVQQDKADDRDLAPLVRGLQAKFAVASHVEKVNTTSMPSTAQVRYFNDADRNQAEQLAAQLKGNGYATLQTVRVGLPAPAGQVEVWLPRDATAPAQLRIPASGPR